MEGEPRQPCEGSMKAKPGGDLHDGLSPTDRRHLSFVPVSEIFDRLVSLSADELPCHMFSLLDGHWGDHWQRSTVANDEARCVTDDPHIVRELCRRSNLQSIRAIGLAEKVPRRRGNDACGPYSCPGYEFLSVLQDQ